MLPTFMWICKMKMKYKKSAFFWEKAIMLTYRRVAHSLELSAETHIKNYKESSHKKKYKTNEKSCERRENVCGVGSGSWVEFGRFFDVEKCSLKKREKLCKRAHTTCLGMEWHYISNSISVYVTPLSCVFIVQKWTQSFSFFLLTCWMLECTHSTKFHEHIHRTRLGHDNRRSFTRLFTLPSPKFFFEGFISFVFSHPTFASLYMLLIVVVFYIYFCPQPAEQHHHQGNLRT